MIPTILRGCYIIVPKSRNKHRPYGVSAISNEYTNELSTRPAHYEAQVSLRRRSVAMKIQETITTYKWERINRVTKVIIIIRRDRILI